MNRNLRFFAMAVFTLTFLINTQSFAAEKYFTVVNQTSEVLRINGKSNKFKFGRAKPRTIIECACNPLYNKDCFDKKEGRAKIKIVAEDPNGIDLWSGNTCSKIYIKPGTFINVTMQLDGKHINCEILDEFEIDQPVPEFDKADKNKDGVIDKEEAKTLNIDSHLFDYDSDLNNKMDKDEYNGAMRKLNIFRGVPF